MAGVFPNIKAGRIAKTKRYLADPNGFGIEAKTPQSAYEQARAAIIKTPEKPQPADAQAALVDARPEARYSVVVNVHGSNIA